MSKEVYQADLQRKIQDLGFRMNEARGRLECGEPREKVEAAGELANLEGRHAALREKLARLEKEPEGAWENLRTALENEFDSLFADLRRWIDTH